MLLSACAPKETPPYGALDLDSLKSQERFQSNVDMALIESSQPKPSSADDPPPEAANTSPPSKPTLSATTLPASEPHKDSPGGIIADNLQVFQCEKSNAESQERFFLHILNYRIHTLGSHPLCEVIQVTDIKKILAYAHYQRDYCDTYTSNFIKKLTQYQCTHIITLMPSDEAPVEQNTGL